MYSNDILLPNSELWSKSTLLSDNIVCSIVNKINSVGFRFNSAVLDFILNNKKDISFL